MDRGAQWATVQGHKEWDTTQETWKKESESRSVVSDSLLPHAMDFSRPEHWSV